MKLMQDIDLSNKRVLIRQDLNVPIKDCKVTSDARIRASLPTLQQALAQGAAVIVMSHCGRPVEGGTEEENGSCSLQPVADYMAELLGQEVPLIKDYLDTPVQVLPGEIVLLENVRFNQGEKEDNETLAKQYAALCDVFVWMLLVRHIVRKHPRMA